jgi:hypothetical protein
MTTININFLPNSPQIPCDANGRRIENKTTLVLYLMRNGFASGLPLVKQHALLRHFCKKVRIEQLYPIVREVRKMEIMHRTPIQDYFVRGRIYREGSIVATEDETRLKEPGVNGNWVRVKKIESNLVPTVALYGIPYKTGEVNIPGMGSILAFISRLYDGLEKVPGVDTSLSLGPVFQRYIQAGAEHQPSTIEVSCIQVPVQTEKERMREEGLRLYRQQYSKSRNMHKSKQDHSSIVAVEIQSLLDSDVDLFDFDVVNDSPISEEDPFYIPEDINDSRPFFNLAPMSPMLVF